MDERIVPSIRHRRSGWQGLFIADDRWRDGGLEAQNDPCTVMYGALPISPLSKQSPLPWCHLRIIQTLLPKIALMFIETIHIYHYNTLSILIKIILET